MKPHASDIWISIGLVICVIAASCFWSSEAPLIVGPDSILRLPVLSYWRNLPAIFSADFTAFTDGQYRPLAYALFAVARSFVSVESTWFWQLLLRASQALNAVLVYAVARRLLGSRQLGIVAAGVFALHPLAGVVLNDISQFHYALGLTLCLGSMCAYLAGIARGQERPRGGCRCCTYSACSAGLFAAGLLTTKAALGLPAIVVAYELMRGKPVRQAAKRVLPFVVLALLMALLWWTQTPHPMRYRYPQTPAGTWHRSSASVVAGSEYYLRGLVLGSHIPAILEELVKSRGWGTDLALLGPTALYLLLLFLSGRLMWVERRDRATDESIALGLRGNAGLALLWGSATFVPFASMGWNCVDAFVSWSYLYFPLVGLSLLAAVLLGAAAQSKTVIVRRGALCLLVAWCGLLGVRLVQQNLAARSAKGHWQHMLELSPQSAMASVQLGRIYLHRGDMKRALSHLFNPSVTKVSRSCLAMADYYLLHNELLAAAVHYQRTTEEAAGLQCQIAEPLLARLHRAAGALDYAEANWGQVVIANPFHTRGMAEMADLWQLKGFVRAARRLIARARRIDPSDPALREMEQRIQAGREPSPTVAVVAGEQLRYFARFRDDPAIRGDIVSLSEHLTDDPMVQLQAGLVLVQGGKANEALARLSAALPALQSSSLLWALQCHAFAQMGHLPAAMSAAEQAMRAPHRDARAYAIVGTAMMKRGQLPHAVMALRRAVETRDDSFGGHLNLALALQRTDNVDEAIDHFRKAIELEPYRPAGHLHLGAAYLKKGDTDSAVQSLRAVLRLNPGSAKAHMLLGDAFMKRGDRGAAANHLAQAERISPGCTRQMPQEHQMFVPERSRQWQQAQ